MPVELDARRRHVAPSQGVDDGVMVAPGGHRVRIGQREIVGRLEEGEPEHVEQPQERDIAEALEHGLVEGLVLLGEGFAAFGPHTHPFRDPAELGNLGLSGEPHRVADQRPLPAPGAPEAPRRSRARNGAGQR